MINYKSSFKNYFYNFALMYLFRLFLTVYFMVLSIMPCNDVAAKQLLNNNTNFTYLNSTQNNSHSGNDACSPLCFCNCCQIVITSFKIEPIIIFPEQVHNYFSKKIFFQKNDFAYLIYDQIWQPPKI